MAKQSAKPKDKSKKQKSAAQLAVQVAGKITGDLICSLQNVRKSFLRVGQLLTEVRDRKHYETLHHEDMESYAAQRLKLGRDSMYRYMKVYAWVLEHHNEWLEPGTKVRIPDLSDIGGLIWVERELEKKNLAASRKAALENLKEKALAGELLQKDLRAFKRRASTSEQGDRRLLTSLRALRRRFGKSRSASAQQVVPLLDQGIDIMEHDLAVAMAGLDVLDGWVPRPGRAELLSRKSFVI